MNKADILLIRASHTSEDVRNFRREVPADISVLVPQVVSNYQAESFPLGDFDGYIITGSKSSVLEQEEWMSDLSVLTERIIEDNRPILGVCWGHQFIADLLGGEVESKEKRELGYRGIEIVEDRKTEYSSFEVDSSGLFMGFPDRFAAFETHGDYVVELPDNAELLAENEAGIQSFKHENAYGVQFHPEFDYETALKSYESYKENETVPGDPRISPELYSRSKTSSDVFNNFVSQIIGSSN